jgi:hypothetical protein
MTSYPPNLGRTNTTFSLHLLDSLAESNSMETVPEPDFMNVSGAQESILTASLAGRYVNPMCSLKGQCHEIFCFWFFS